MRSGAALCCQRLRRYLREGRPAPTWLLEDAIEALQRVESRELVRERRDEYIRRAAALLPASVASKPADIARALLAEARALRRSAVALNAAPPEEPPATARDALLLALQIAGDAMPDSARQMVRILGAASEQGQ